jgi:NADH dehydrogenase [ubiquinone] 1 alpha subcomplex assembly factor 5
MNRILFRLKGISHEGVKKLRGARRLSSTVDVFDRSLKKRQREWSIKADESDYYDYLRKESADRLVDRLEDISRTFPLALELGCHRGHIFDLLDSAHGLSGTGGIGGVEKLVQCDISPTAVALANQKKGELGLVKNYGVVCDEEFLPFQPKTFDAVFSSLSLHWINNIPSTLLQVKEVLKPDGVFLASMLGGESLKELRHCFYLAEQERRGGFSPHASPFAKASDVASLMQAADFALPTIDVDTVTVGTFMITSIVLIIISSYS